MVLLVFIVEVWYLFEEGFSPLCACGLFVLLLLVVVVVLVMVVVLEYEEEEVEEFSELEAFIVDEAILCGEREDLVLLSWLWQSRHSKAPLWFFCHNRLEVALHLIHTGPPLALLSAIAAYSASTYKRDDHYLF